MSWDKLKEILKSTDVKTLEKESTSNTSKEEKKNLIKIKNEK
jgi:hypothetical protein